MKVFALYEYLLSFTRILKIMGVILNAISWGAAWKKNLVLPIHGPPTLCQKRKGDSI